MRIRLQNFLSRDFYVPAGLLVLNLFLKMLFLNSRDLAMDEPFTVFYAQGGLPFIFHMLPSENNPPLFFLLLHFWINIFGISVFSVRFLSCIFSSLLVLVIWLIGRKFISFRTGLVASLLYTFSGYEILFAHEARVYPLFAFLTALSFFLFLSMVREPKKKKYPVLLTITNILLIYSHFFGFVALLTQVVCCLAIKEIRQKVLRFYLITLALTLVAFIPYFPITLSRFSASSGGTWIPAPQWSDLYTMVWRFSNAPVVTVFFILILSGAGIMFCIRSRRWEILDKNAVLMVILWFFFPFLFLFLVSFRTPVFLDRYMIFITPAWYLLIAMAIDRLSVNRFSGYILITATVTSMLITFNPDVDNKRRIKEVVAKVESLKKPGVPVVICPEWLKYSFAYYYDREAFKDYENLDARMNRENIYPVNDYSRLDTVFLKQAPAAIYFEEWATLVDKETRIQKGLEVNFPFRTSWKIFESYSVTWFSK
ncbi:MAG: glycosyltransferase family 39 protein [Bacteroidota bacterium]|nr:glycosyltransferase family 39 protein [Bacteroidota bacterium]